MALIWSMLMKGCSTLYSGGVSTCAHQARVGSATLPPSEQPQQIVYSSGHQKSDHLLYMKAPDLQGRHAKAGLARSMGVSAF